MKLAAIAILTLTIPAFASRGGDYDVNLTTVSPANGHQQITATITNNGLKTYFLTWEINIVTPAGEYRRVAVGGKKIKPGQMAVADHDLIVTEPGEYMALIIVTIPSRPLNVVSAYTHFTVAPQAQISH